MNTVVTFFQSGGTFMYPIAVVLVIGLALAIERWVFLTAAKSSNQHCNATWPTRNDHGSYCGIYGGC